MPADARTGSARLYTPRLLSLATALADYPLSDDLPQRGEARSRSCGSTVELGVETDAGDRVTRIGMQVAACAIGQASAAVLALAAQGRTATDFVQALTQIDAWLDGQGTLPEWPGFDALEPARAHPGRRDALRIPWTAMLAALSSDASAR